jgi:glucose 1-dehydrogenase
MNFSSHRLEGKVAVVTGGSRGLGLAISRAFVRAGAAVAIASRSEEAVRRVAEELRAAGGQVIGVPTDVANLEAVQDLARQAVSKFGKLDVWVNNAGMSGPYGPTAALPVEDFTRALRTNIEGVYYGSLTAMRYFLAQKSGKLINILGRGDRNPVPYQNAYAPTKAWVRSFTLAMAKEYSDCGVGVYALQPGLMLTDLVTEVEVVPGYEGRLRAFQTVLRMWANPPEVPAEKAVWLASSATDGQTGLEVRVLTPKRLLLGAVAELFRRLTKRPAQEIPIHIRQLPGG